MNIAQAQNTWNEYHNYKKIYAIWIFFSHYYVSEIWSHYSLLLFYHNLGRRKKQIRYAPLITPRDLTSPHATSDGLPEVNTKSRQLTIMDMEVTSLSPPTHLSNTRARAVWKNLPQDQRADSMHHTPWDSNKTVLSAI
jgi:hypothetical protein